jgi:hypothetical protein
MEEKIIDKKSLFDEELRSGTIVIEQKGLLFYAKYVEHVSPDSNGKKRRIINLGRVIDQQNNIYRNNKLGYFCFIPGKGFQEVPSTFVPPTKITKTNHLTLDFGDIWMIDQVIQQIGLDKILNSILPEHSDTLKSVIGYRLLCKGTNLLAKYWYEGSYASVLYPKANLNSPRLSEFDKLIGLESVYRDFFQQYINLINSNRNISEQIKSPILIDSTGLQNDIKTYLTAVNNHNGVVNNEIRLIYVVDKITRLPIYFRYVPGNIIDNSTLIDTLNHLFKYNVSIDLLVMDAGYSSFNNLEQLTSLNIPFITRMTQNRTEYKKLMEEHGHDLVDLDNMILYSTRLLYGKKVSISLFGKTLYAYIMLDIDKVAPDHKRIAVKYVDNPDQYDKLREQLSNTSKFVLLSSEDYTLQEILPLYYCRQEIEQVFDICKNNANILPLRSHSEETIRGKLLINFILAILYSSINVKLFGKKYNASTALFILQRLRIDVYEDAKFVKELTKEQKEIFENLALASPYSVETGTVLTKKPLTSPSVTSTTKRGRPKGSKNKVYENIPVPNFDKTYVKTSNSTETCFSSKPTAVKLKRGRPIGSKNRPKISVDRTKDNVSELKRKPGRPKGSKNKTKFNFTF